MTVERAGLLKPAYDLTARAWSGLMCCSKCSCTWVHSAFCAALHPADARSLQIVNRFLLLSWALIFAQTVWTMDEKKPAMLMQAQVFFHLSRICHDESIM